MTYGRGIVGDKYEATKDLRRADIAKLIRADIKDAKAKGLLPAAWRYTVRTHEYAGGGAIDMEIVDCPDAWVEEDLARCPIDGRTGVIDCQPHFHRGGGFNRCPGARHLTDVAEAAKDVLERIHAAYNFDNSDPMTDYFHVRYYGIVTVETPEAAKWAAREKARKAARKAARLAAA